MFEKFPDARDKLLDMLKGNRIMLRKFPEVIRAMYRGEYDQIPEDLRVEDNLHKSMVVDKIEEHMSRR